MRATDGQDSVKYDVVVVGGGAAGLSGALTLGRARRDPDVAPAGRERPADGGSCGVQIKQGRITR